jgi:hypothetical protein
MRPLAGLANGHERAGEMIKARKPHGFRDRDEADIAAERRMLDTIRRVYESQRAETPAFEYTDAWSRSWSERRRSRSRTKTQGCRCAMIHRAACALRGGEFSEPAEAVRRYPTSVATRNLARRHHRSSMPTPSARFVRC